MLDTSGILQHAMRCKLILVNIIIGRNDMRIYRTRNVQKTVRCCAK